MSNEQEAAAALKISNQLTEALMKYRNQGPAGVSGGSVTGVWCGHWRRGEGALSQG